MVKKFVYAVNAVPFAGKLMIRPLAYCYWNATSILGKALWFVSLVLVLMVFIFAHGIQAFLGFQRFDLTQNLVLNIIFISYGVVNLFVTVAQMHLLYRAIKHITKRLPRAKREYVNMGHIHIILCVVITLLGQIFFILAVSLSQAH